MKRTIFAGVVGDAIVYAWEENGKKFYKAKPKTKRVK